MTGEDYPSRKRLRLPEYDYGQTGLYFVTICTHVRQQDVLCSIEPVGGGLCAAPRPQLTALGEVVDAAISDIPRFNPGSEIDAYCIMPDHVHLIVALTGRHGGRPLPDIIGRMKSYTQMRYRQSGAPFGPKLWQESYYDHVIRNQQDLAETRRYIRDNPCAYLERRPL